MLCVYLCLGGTSVRTRMVVGSADVFGAEAEADHAGGDAAQDWEML